MGKISIIFFEAIDFLEPYFKNIKEAFRLVVKGVKKTWKFDCIVFALICLVIFTKKSIFYHYEETNFTVGQSLALAFREMIYLVRKFIVGIIAIIIISGILSGILTTIVAKWADKKHIKYMEYKKVTENNTIKANGEEKDVLMENNDEGNKEFDGNIDPPRGVNKCSVGPPTYQSLSFNGQKVVAFVKNNLNLPRTYYETYIINGLIDMRSKYLCSAKTKDKASNKSFISLGYYLYNSLLMKKDKKNSERKFIIEFLDAMDIPHKPELKVYYDEKSIEEALSFIPNLKSIIQQINNFEKNQRDNP